MGRTAMSRRELGRVEVLARVASEELKLVDAAKLLGLSHRAGGVSGWRGKRWPGGGARRG